MPPVPDVPAGNHFKVKTDHKPLLPILKKLTSQASARIDNWHLKLQSFDFEVLYSRGGLNPADCISRHLQGTSHCDLIVNSAEQYLNFILTQATPKAVSRDDIIQATPLVGTLQEVMRLISNGQRDNLKPVDGVDPNTLRIVANVRD